VTFQSFDIQLYIVFFFLTVPWVLNLILTILLQQSKCGLNNDRSSKDVVMKDSISSELRHITVHILKHVETKPNESKQDRETTQQRCTT
jgi:hypothetical protein